MLDSLKAKSYCLTVRTVKQIKKKQKLLWNTYVYYNDTKCLFFSIELSFMCIFYIFLVFIEIIKFCIHSHKLLLWIACTGHASLIWWSILVLSKMLWISTNYVFCFLWMMRPVDSFVILGCACTGIFLSSMLRRLLKSISFYVYKILDNLVILVVKSITVGSLVSYYILTKLLVVRFFSIYIRYNNM